LNRLPKLLEQHCAINLILDAETGQIVDANNAAERFYGWPLAVLKQMNIQEINTLPPEALQDAMKIGVMSGSIVFEFCHRRADGSIRNVEVFSNKIESGGKDFLYSIIHDITDRKQAEEALRQSEVNLQAANEKLRQQNEELLQLWEKSRQTEDDLNRANQILIRQTAELATIVERR
jgi:PAS domain S-box-containing protein